MRGLGLGHPYFLDIFKILTGKMMAFLHRIKKPAEIYVLLATFVFTEQFDRNLDLEVVEEGSIRNFLEISHSFLDVLTNHMKPVGAVFFVYAFLLIGLSFMGRSVRKAVDILAVFLTGCWILELAIMNLLLVAPIKSPVLLIVELLLFIPIILICFSWWYWRINEGRSIKKMPPAILVQEAPGALEYFFFAAEVVFDYSQDSCKTSMAKMVRFLNGFVVLDVFGLTLSRAVDLAIS